MAQQHSVGKVHTAVQRTKDGIVRVIYHSTCVVEVTPEGIRLDSGGWRTATTKTRINQASNQFNLGFRVYADKGEWFVRTYRGGDMKFSDGMLLNQGIAVPGRNQ